MRKQLVSVSVPGQFVYKEATSPILPQSFLDSPTTMSPIRYMLTFRDEATTSGVPAPTQSSSPESPSLVAPTARSFVPWLATAIIMLFLLAVILSCNQRRNRPRPSENLHGSLRSHAAMRKRRPSVELLLHPGVEKDESAISAPPPAYTAAGDNVAPGQEDAIFRPNREFRRSLYVLDKPRVQTPPPFQW
ncbi:hypothetical protein B0H15DRAFT_1025116 [Mycena belliarum]|uniref:Uncharacterized protein n=1 Tax=Mycena belliarum TaxID=1033014 RepID=A0AAD6TX32_9AGAR|nr:hypothetical protein B0H15DRAFT_1025116 [Mycena belliae]